MQVQILHEATSSAAPTAADDGVPLLRGSARFLNPGDGFPDGVDDAMLFIYATADDALSIAYARLWSRAPVDAGGTDLSQWVPPGTGDYDKKGRLNADAGTPYVLAETDTTNHVLVHAERVYGLKDFRRVALELGTVTGTNAKVWAWLVARG